RRSGLLEAIDILQKVEGLSFVRFDEADVVRHHLVQRIIRAYDEHKTHVAEQQMLLLSGGRNPDATRGETTAHAKNTESANSGFIASGE
ncbi:MAG: PhoH family protein, partial [Candidatus Sulfotelmatobacter sp.]